MSYSYIDLYIARKMMKFKYRSSSLSFVSTLWKGEVVMCTFDNLSEEISQLHCSQYVDSDDMQQLEDLIRKFVVYGIKNYK